MLDKSILKSKEKIKLYMNEVYDVKFVIKYLTENCKEEYKSKKIVANLLMKNIFLFNDSWDMEACYTPYKNKELNWTFTPNGDEEWTFMLNRQEYLYKLLLVYYVEGKKEYIEKLKEFILNWIDNNNLNDSKMEARRAIDTGIRINSWVEILKHLINEDLINENELEKILKSIREQISYLKKIYKEKYTLSNWGILQTSAIINSYIWFGDYIGNKEIFNWAIEEFNRQVDIQIFEDGSQWEQSPMYHVEVLKAIFNYAYNMEVGLYKIEKNIMQVIEKMTDFILYSMSPTGCFEAQCDSDRTKVIDIIEKGSILTKKKKYFKFLNNEYSLSTVFTFGKKVLEVNKNIKKEILKKSKSFIDSGNIYIRNSWTKEGDFTLIKNGTLGSGHGHCDLGHISIYSDGNPFLVDAGRYSYEEDDVMREYLKSAYAHNVCVIDDLPAAIPKGAWDYEYYSDCFKNYYKEKENIHYAEINYVNEYKENFMLVTRKYLYIECGIWLVVTDTKCKGNHKMSRFYHLDSNVILEKKEKNEFIGENNSKIIMEFIDEEDVKIKDGIISRTYNKLENNKKIIIKNNFRDKLITKDIFLKENIKRIVNGNLKIRVCDGKIELEKDKYIIEEFKVSETEAYTIIIFSGEKFTGRKLHYYNDNPIYGKIVVMKKKDGIVKNIVLRG